MFDTNNNNFVGSHYELRKRDFEADMSRRKAAHERLWTVHDSYVDDPKERFQSTKADILIEVNCESGYGPMGDNRPSEDMVLFVTQMLGSFGVSPHRYEAEDAVQELLYHLDFQEPYWVLCDAAVVSVQGGNVAKTYRFKDTGRTVEPDACEVFEINMGWQFSPYEAMMSMLNHPLAKQIMAGYTVYHPTSKEVLTKQYLLNKVIECVWGPAKGFLWMIDELLENRYQNEVYYKSETPYQADDAQINYDLDRQFFMYAFAAGMLWLRGPQAIQYLIATHPVYAALLSWDEVNRHPLARPDTGNMAVITGWDVYTAEHMHVVDTPAGTCVGCGQTLHCTKFVNINGLRGDPCTCGRGQHDPQDTILNNHNNNCAIHTTAKFEFICHKCMYNLTYGAETIKCGRAVCPNTTCGWHMGEVARRNALTEKRKLMLTGPSH